MELGKALAIFHDIENKNASVDEKAVAIRTVIGMATHNSVKKDVMLEVINWLWNQCFEWNEEEKDAT